MNDHDTIKWTDYEFEHRPKTPDWYWALGIIAIAGTVTAILLENYLFAIFIIIAALALSYFGRKEPRIIDYKVNRHGIKIDNILYPYLNLEGFWIDYNEERPRLLLHSTQSMNSIISICIEETDTAELRDFLRDYLPEKELRESVSYRIMKFFGF